MSKSGNPLETSAVVIEGKYYRVEPMPSDETLQEKGPVAIFRKGIAYLYKTQLENLLLPYRGQITKDELRPSELQVGIYAVKKAHSGYSTYIQRPHNRHELKTFKGGQERDIMVAVNDFTADQFADVRVAAPDAGGKIFYPPLHTDDDSLNLLMKTAIRSKQASFEPYGKRLEALAVEKGHGVEGVNIRNNTKRAINLNRAMSPNKFLQYADVWQFETVFLLRDRSDSMHPMFDDGTILAIFPSGQKFTIDPDKILDITLLIEEGLKETVHLEPDDEEGN